MELLKENNIPFKSIMLAQDAAMQRRMEAGLRKYVAEDVIIINYAVYSAKVIGMDSELTFEKEIKGMWDMDQKEKILSLTWIFQKKWRTLLRN